MHERVLDIAEKICYRVVSVSSAKKTTSREWIFKAPTPALETIANSVCSVQDWTSNLCVCVLRVAWCGLHGS
jgi:hypothetical protein